jgi:hypothetical protein
LIAFEICFLALQTVVVLFLLFHDWVPLGRFTNRQALRSQDSVARTVVATTVNALLPSVGLFFSIKYFGKPYPHWLAMLLWFTYGLLLLGLLHAWWIPYLWKPEPERAARYEILFGDTHAFLPKRNGIVPNTIHTCFHAATVAILCALLVRSRFLSV